MIEVKSLGTVNFSNIVEKGLYIPEEYTWSPVGQTRRYSLAGTLVLTENLKTGKPLTLTAKEDGAWLTEATVLALRTLANNSLQLHNLVLVNDSGVTEIRSVLFRRNPDPLDLQPLLTTQQYFVGSIHLIQM